MPAGRFVEWRGIQPVQDVSGYFRERKELLQSSQYPLLDLTNNTFTKQSKKVLKRRVFRPLALKLECRTTGGLFLRCQSRHQGRKRSRSTISVRSSVGVVTLSPYKRSS